MEDGRQQLQGLLEARTTGFLDCGHTRTYGMAGRRYVRDNRGRFATVGATARGGRLATAAGNKRETVKGKIDGAVPAGTIRPGRRSKPKAVETPTRGRRDPLKSGPLAKAPANVKEGLAAMPRKTVNRVEVAARLSALNAAGKLNNLSGVQAHRAEGLLRSAQRSVNAAPKIAAEKAQIALRIKAAAQRRGEAAPRAAVSGRPLRERRGIPGTVRPSRYESRSEGGRVTRQVMRDMPAVPKGRKPDDTWQGINSFNTSSSRPRTLSGRQATAMQQTLSRQGWTRRSDALGRSVTYSKSFDGPGGTSEIGRVRVTGRGGPLASRQVEVSRMVSSRPGRRNSSGGLIEARYGLRRNRPASVKPRRR